MGAAVELKTPRCKKERNDEETRRTFDAERPKPPGQYEIRGERFGPACNWGRRGVARGEEDAGVVHYKATWERAQIRHALPLRKTSSCFVVERREVAQNVNARVKDKKGGEKAEFVWRQRGSWGPRTRLPLTTSCENCPGMRISGRASIQLSVRSPDDEGAEKNKKGEVAQLGALKGTTILPMGYWAGADRVERKKPREGKRVGGMGHPKGKLAFGALRWGGGD